MRTSMPSDKSALSLLASAAVEETETTCARKIHQWKFWRKKNEEEQREEERTYTLFRTLPRNRIRFCSQICLNIRNNNMGQ